MLIHLQLQKDQKYKFIKNELKALCNLKLSIIVIKDELKFINKLGQIKSELNLGFEDIRQLIKVLAVLIVIDATSIIVK